MNRAQIVDHYLARISEPHFDISVVRKELEKNSVPENEIRIIVKLVDSEIQRRLLDKSETRASFDVSMAGVILMIVGAGITIATYTGVIDMGNSFLVVYGPFLTGFSLYLGGKAKRSTRFNR